MRLRGGALGERNFRYLFSARAISFFGTNLAPIAVTTAIVLSVRDVREFRLRLHSVEIEELGPAAALT